jgi:hypothetical protein
MAMTLQEAIAWKIAVEMEVHAALSSTTKAKAEAIAVHLVDLIPASDARLAVALAYQRAGDIAAAQETQANRRSQEDDDETQSDWDGGVLFGTEIGARIIAKDILALANSDDLAEVQALRKERDSFRAVLEGACYGDIDGIAKNAPEMSRMLGDAVMQMTKARLNRAEAAEAEVARLTGELGELRKDYYSTKERLAEYDRAALTAQGDAE